MLEVFNNFWVIIISTILIFIIIKKIYNFFEYQKDEIDINEYLIKKEISEINSEKLKKKLSIDNIKMNVSDITSYYLGV
uniref:Uncharacterized protein n=1 Tax=viral metagenome TaxID=1070528 RepID=A0A6C0EEH7_9ZZZZ